MSVCDWILNIKNEIIKDKKKEHLMEIKYLSIKNFKSIRHMEISDIQNALILVGKNNTGKSSILHALRAVEGSYESHWMI